MDQRLDTIERLLETVAEQTAKNATAIAALGERIARLEIQVTKLALTAEGHYADLKAEIRRLEDKIDALPDSTDGTYAPLLNELSDRVNDVEVRVALLER